MKFEHRNIPVACDDKPLPISSSAPPEFPPEQESLFREVLTLLNERGVPYAVSGAFALREHTGICRNTKDLDLFLAPEDVPKALTELKREGFETEVKDPVWLAKAHRDDFFVDLITGMSNGIVTVDRNWIERATPSQIMGVPVRVLGAEELLASKLFIAFRERFDGADIVHVIYGTRGKLDWKRVMQLVGEHWQLLLWALVLFQYVYPHQAQVVPQAVWNDLLQRFRSNLTAPNTDTNFRGSLLDERMFAIDVNEWGLDNLLEESRARREPKIPDDATSKPAA
jgi:predicted nucleotidyltransferase